MSNGGASVVVLVVVVVVGGVIPPQDFPALEKLGVAGIFGPGTVISDAARELIKKINGDS